MTRPFAVIAGGGTAGHVIPAVEVGRALVARGHAAGSIRFVGSARGMEARMVPAAGFPIVLLPGRGIERKVSLVALGAVVGLVAAAVRAVALLIRHRPRVVFIVGGYASAPCALGAIVLRIPLVVHEQNAVPGAVNRLAGRFARQCAVSFAGTPLPRAVLTGNPVRAEIAAVDRSPAGRAAARALLGLPDDRVVVAVTGGSLGARRINAATYGLAQRWSERADVAVRHVVGRRDWATDRAALPAPAPGGLVYAPVEYEDRMPALLAAADVVVQRAGGSVSELCVAAVPSLLVPLPTAPGDHQTANARVLVDAGAAVLVPDADLTPERLDAELTALAADDARRAAMSRSAAALARPDAAAAVAALVEQAAGHA